MLSTQREMLRELKAVQLKLNSKYSEVVPTVSGSEIKLRQTIGADVADRRLKSKFSRHLL